MTARTRPKPSRNGIPPHSKLAEQAVLGCILRDNSTATVVRRIIGADDLYTDAHQRIYRTMVAMVATGKAVDAVTLATQLELSGEFADVGGAPYLAKLYSPDLAAVPASVASYAETVRQHSLHRQLLRLFEDGLEAFVGF